MFLLGVLEDALGTEHFIIVFAEELNFLGCMHSTVRQLQLDRLIRRGRRVGASDLCRRLLVLLGEHGQTRQHLVVHWEVVRCHHVHGLVVGTSDRVVLKHLATALQTEGVTAWQRQWFLILVVVGLEADTAFKY